MLFKEFFQEIELLDRLEHQIATDVDWAISTNVGNLMPLHLIETAWPLGQPDRNADWYTFRKERKQEKKEKREKYPKFSTLGDGETNPKTAKHPETQQTYLGAVLHLEPYMGSGSQMCPFATAIYHISAKGFDPQTLQLVASSPGYEQNGDIHTFYGFELRPRTQQSMQTHGSLSDTLLPKDQQQSCPLRLRLRLPGANLQDWNSGQTIEINRNQIVKTELVGGCASACLHTAGNPALATTKLQGRRNKTQEFVKNSQGFMSKVLLDLFKLVAASQEKGHQPVVRLNATSDVYWESDEYRFSSNVEELQNTILTSWPKRIIGKYAQIVKQLVGSNANKFQELVRDVASFIAGKTLLETFPNVTFYDYTKDPSRMARFIRKTGWPKNYHLTFSLAEDNRNVAKKFLEQGGTVAAVFNVEKNPKSEGPLPRTWAGFPVIDADKHDYRFLDQPGTVAGLRAKGEAKFKTTNFGFVIQPDDPDLDPNDPAVIQAKEYVSSFERRIKSGELDSRPGARRKAFKQAGEKLSLPVLY
jgi:hypothetical protein